MELYTTQFIIYVINIIKKYISVYYLEIFCVNVDTGGSNIFDYITYYVLGFIKPRLKKSYDVFWTFLEAFKTGMEIHRVEYLYEKSTRGAKPRQ